MDRELHLTDQQALFLQEHEELILALFEVAGTPAFREAFGDLSLGGALDFIEAALPDDEEDDPVLRERYLRLQNELKTDNHAEKIKKLRESAEFWKKELFE